MPKILIVDDTQDLLDLFTIFFEWNGYEVRTAPDGKTALNILSEFVPDLVLMDIVLNGENGRAICRKIRKRNFGKKIYIILISVDTALLADCEECGADDTIEKPFDIERVLAKINSLLGRVPV